MDSENMPTKREKIPIPPLARTAYTTKKTSKIPKTLAEKQTFKKEVDRARNKTRVNIGAAYERWRALRVVRSLKTDAELATFLLNSYEKKSSTLMTSTGTSTHDTDTLTDPEDVFPSERGTQHQREDVEHQSETTPKASEVDFDQDSAEEMEVSTEPDECNSVTNRLSGLDGGKAAETVEQGAVDNCDEQVYITTIPQSSTKSEFLLECEEEELQPSQKPTPHVRVKEEEEDGDCKPDPSLLQRIAGNTSPPKIKEETEETAVFDNQLTGNTASVGSLETQCHAGSSSTVLPVAQQQLFQKVATLTVKLEECETVKLEDCEQIINSPVSLSSVRSPAEYSATSYNQLQSDKSHSQTLPVTCALPEVETAGGRLDGSPGSFLRSPESQIGEKQVIYKIKHYLNH